MNEKQNRPAGINGRAAMVWVRYDCPNSSMVGGRCLGGGA